MAFSINDIRSNLQYGGARPSLFQVIITNPADSRGNIKLPFMVHASQMPASHLGEIQIPYFGRRIKLPGVRTYDNWTVQVFNDEDFAVRASLEAWSASINTYEGNIRNFGSSSPAEFKARGQVNQYSQVGQVIRTYNFEGLFPLEVGQIELSWADGDNVEVFPVTFAVDYWTIDGENNSN